MRRTPWRAVSLVLVLGLALMSCDGPNRGANTQPSSPSGFSLVVTASPNVLRATGTQGSTGDCTVITVKVFDSQGRLVDGVTVTVAVSDATFTGTTIRGTFTTGACAGTARGTVTVTATVEDAVATTFITVI